MFHVSTFPAVPHAGKGLIPKPSNAALQKFVSVWYFFGDPTPVKGGFLVQV